MSFTALLIIVGAVSLGAFTKGLTGLGLPLVAVPLMAGFLGVERAVVVMAIPTAVTNAWLMWEHRGHAGETRDLRRMVGWGVVGTAAGVWLLVSLDPRVLSGALAAVIGVYVVLFLAYPALHFPAGMTRLLSPVVGAGAGILHGATGISGPVVGTYFHGFRLRQGAYILSVASVTQVFAFLQIGGFVVLGMYTSDRILASLVALLPIIAVLPLGVRVSRRLAQRPFELVVLAILAVMGVRLLFDALGG